VSSQYFTYYPSYAVHEKAHLITIPFLETIGACELIEAVTFDLWNTLFTNRNYTEFRVNYLANVLKERGIARSRDEILEAYVFANEYAMRVGEQENYRQVTNEEKLEYILERIRVDLPKGVKATAVKRFEEAIWYDPPLLKEGVAETLEALEPCFGMAIISDTGVTPGRVVRRVLRDLGALHFFKSTVFSDEMGLCKPNEAMFRTALNELGVGPSEAVHVGDLLHTDVVGAKAVGMRAIWVKTRETPMLNGLKPDYVISSISQVVGILDEINA
jgi:putative hydrolase of the HAD superfamily